jgi:hypothetical protein
MVTPPVSTPASGRGSEAGQRIDAEGGRVSVAVAQSITAQIRQIPPLAVSNSLKSVCQTRFRCVGGSWKTRRGMAL